MSDEIIICIAPSPGEKQEEKYPGKLDVADELIRCETAGASIGHLHARDDNLLQVVDPTIFASQVRAVVEATPMIIEGSTGGAPEHTIQERCSTFTVPEVELGSLNLGSINMFDGVYQNKYEDICEYARLLHKHQVVPTGVIFDLSHMANLRRLLDDGELARPYLLEFVFDVPYALPYQDQYLDLYLEHMPEPVPWFCVRHHQHGAAALGKVIDLGGHIRVGYEDSPFLSSGKRAENNVQLVEDAVKETEKRGRRVVRADRAREILGLRSR